MASIPVPVLGTQGFATDSVTKFSTLFAHLFESDYNQTQLYPGKVYSISRILEQSGADLSLIRTNLKQSLSTYLTNYYDSASVDVTVVPSSVLLSSYQINLDIRVYDQGQEILTAWSFTAKDNVASKVINLSNNGG